MLGTIYTHLIIVFLGECDGCQFVVLLHEVLVSKEVESSLLMRFDRLLEIGKMTLLEQQCGS